MSNILIYIMAVIFSIALLLLTGIDDMPKQKLSPDGELTINGFKVDKNGEYVE